MVLSGGCVAALELVRAQFAARGGKAGDGSDLLDQTDAAVGRPRVFSDGSAAAFGALPQRFIDDQFARRFEPGGERGNIAATRALGMGRIGGDPEAGNGADNGKAGGQEGPRYGLDSKCHVNSPLGSARRDRNGLERSGSIYVANHYLPI